MCSPKDQTFFQEKANIYNLPSVQFPYVNNIFPSVSFINCKDDKNKYSEVNPLGT